MQNLATEANTANMTAIRDCGGLGALALLLGSGGHHGGKLAKAAAGALQNLRTDATNASALDALASSGEFPGAARLEARSN